MKALHLLAGAALALTSAWAVAQEAPESILPPGFNDPTPAPPPAPANAPASGASAPSGGGPRTVAVPVVQGAPGRGAAVQALPPAGAPIGEDVLARLPSLDELARMTPEDFQDVLGLKPNFDVPPGSRRAMTRIGLIDEEEGGLPATSLSGQNARLVRVALAGNRGGLVSRWGHILLRRALASRLDAPPNMAPQEFLALRVALLLRMGEPDAARAILQDIDPGNITPDLAAVALRTYTEAGDFTGLCPVITANSRALDDPQWQASKAICSAFRGNGSAAMSQLDRSLSRGEMPRIDLLLAQRYAGAAGRSRRAVTIEWDNVDELTPWRFGLATAVGLQPPEKLMSEAGPRYMYLTALAPAAGLQRRAAAADRAAAAGVLSSQAMVDLYSQIYTDPDSSGVWSERAEALRDAYLLADPGARLSAIQKVWDGASGEKEKYSRQVLTAFAAARLPQSADLADSAVPLIASMLTAGLDGNAMRWAGVVDAGSEGWGLLALAAPSRSSAVDSGSVDKFISNDESAERRKSGFLVAGLAGLGRIDEGTASGYSADLDLKLGEATRWTTAIDGAARSRDVVTVAFLVGLGMQGSGWDRMSPRFLYHVVSALREVGLEAEARMIAAEAVARA
ncbi:hypothetical protein [Novosphingobium album (ex Liu et al. 2023)]|uniref:Lytic transglycosylase domain-containing protein n=1 Tax=Novosphingobium album (ex Liu et al. 2023) TaxID=3031130 RepID=A0ABT5WWV3_9SPHN|nr:hypothetical protein [Novosphingobium album (ex Liu et al. 2023)]MDE8654356.1 hypothetical protein [Novosphingobium album (ex Liu et al. 2023)]